MHDIPADAPLDLAPLAEQAAAGHAIQARIALLKAVDRALAEGQDVALEQAMAVLSGAAHTELALAVREVAENVTIPGRPERRAQTFAIPLLFHARARANAVFPGVVSNVRDIEAHLSRALPHSEDNVWLSNALFVPGVLTEAGWSGIYRTSDFLASAKEAERHGIASDEYSVEMTAGEDRHFLRFLIGVLVTESPSDTQLDGMEHPFEKTALEQLPALLKQGIATPDVSWSAAQLTPYQLSDALEMGSNVFLAYQFRNFLQEGALELPITLAADPELPRVAIAAHMTEPGVLQEYFFKTGLLKAESVVELASGIIGEGRTDQVVNVVGWDDYRLYRLSLGAISPLYD